MDAPTRKLYRSDRNRVLAGVCGGLGEYFAVDPVLIRVVFALSAFMGGAGVLLYIVLALFIPLGPENGARPQGNQGETPDSASGPDAAGGHRRSGRMFLALVLIGIGAIAFAHQFYPIAWFRWHAIWPLALIVLGLYIAIR
ncbi:MAG: PspC domain-containing protein [bacterium]|nr:PspC domain-containing protein [bacterium]